jgi:hypothetical protein
MWTGPLPVRQGLVFPQQHIFNRAMLGTTLPEIKRTVFDYPLGRYASKAKRTQADRLGFNVGHALKLLSFQKLFRCSNDRSYNVFG